MRLLLLALVISAPLAQARILFVHHGRIASGPRFGVRHVSVATDLAFSSIAPGSPKVALKLRRLTNQATYRCDLRGQFVLIGVDARTGAMLSRFRVDRVAHCHPAAVRAMVLASRAGAV